MKTIKLKRDPDLHLKLTKQRGRGVFCTRDLRKGEVLEVTPTLILNEVQSDKAQETILRDYIFSLGGISPKLKKTLGIKKTKDACCVILGVATMCNHDEKPNAEILWQEQEGTIYHILQTKRAIKKGEEICTSYGAGWFDHDRTQNL